MKRKYVSALVTFGFLALFVWYAVANRDSFEALKNVSLAGLVLVAAAKLLVFFSNGLFTKWSAEAFTKRLSLGDGIYVGILSAIGNFFGPLLGGTSIRAVYLKKYHNLSYSKFTSTLMWYYLILFIFVSLVAIVSLLLLDETNQTGALLTFFTAWLVVLVGLTFVRLPSDKKLELFEKNKAGRFVVKVLKEIEDGWNIILQDKRLLLKLLFVSVLSFAGSFLAAYVEFSILNIETSLPALGLYTTLVTASLLLSLTPGAIGIREAMLLIVSTTIGISGAQIVQIAIIDRGVHFILLFALFILTRNSKLKKSLTTKEGVV
ncbi:MAG TPA: lysylphosphatidylglycerol synthase transmembrane domain-containing protein [Candidatus Saccharimonadales bacterium]|nr:lysylphosphatidylglycerol synthase transmembrane domain-containing protein [Candidatus Saccharimonadales bacterium]